MVEFTASAADGSAVHYRDGKRYWWLLSVSYPLQPFIGIALHAATGNPGWLLLPLALTWIGGPLLDWLVGEDDDNPPEAVVPALERDPYYRRLTYAIVPMHLACFYGTAWWAGTQPMPAWAFLALAVLAGMTAGLAINTGHELGHKGSRTERRLAQVALAVPMYGHFTIDHNQGHHVQVSTPEDCSSARMGESIYRFALRELPGVIARAWRLERERLERDGRRAWHPDNRLLRSLALSLAIQLPVVVAFGPVMLPFLAVHNLCAWWQLTSANYVEHYGLLRRRDADGRYERCLPRHSWNSNHRVSNLSLFHLERHSDHHANPQRRYQSLRHFPDLPTLPTGYFGCYLLAWVPPLWFRVMDSRLLALPHVDGRLDRVNIDPASRERLERRYGATRPA